MEFVIGPTVSSFERYHLLTPDPSHCLRLCLPPQLIPEPFQVITAALDLSQFMFTAAPDPSNVMFTTAAE